MSVINLPSLLKNTLWLKGSDNQGSTIVHLYSNGKSIPVKQKRSGSLIQNIISYSFFIIVVSRVIKTLILGVDLY